MATLQSPAPSGMDATSQPPISPPNTLERVESLPEPMTDGYSVTGAHTGAAAMLIDSDPGVQQFTDVVSSAADWDVDLDGMSWPWLHETLFLYDDPLVANMSASVPSQPQLLNNSSEAYGSTSGGGPLAPPENMSASLDVEVNTLIRHATDFACNPETRGNAPEFWRLAATRLQNIVGESIAAADHSNGRNERAAMPHLFHQAIIVHYLPNFNRLWPMLPEDELGLETLHPVLYLVLVSIGSMYGSDKLKQFGMLLHKALRSLLSASLFEWETPEGDLIWMAQARLLTQVQGLYFGQPQSFSYAQVRGHMIPDCTARLDSDET
jgi:hypothetical protein